MSLLLAGGLIALNIGLNVPLFLPGEMPYRDSIEGGYGAMARFFSAHPNPWGWNPTQYGGLPAQFTYLPGLPYLAAALSNLSSLQPDYTYRMLAALFACVGPATLFFFVLYFTGSRGWALSVALAYTFYSPLYHFVDTIDRDRGIAYLPWRFQVLVKYGEGPHNLGLTLIPLALVAVWRAGVGKGFRILFTAAALLAAVALTNWVAALALAFCCLTLLVTLWGSFAETGFRASRIFGAALGYGLACFWLTPSFISAIALNWPKDAFNYHLLRQQVLLLAALPVIVLLLRFALGRVCPRQYYLWFITMTFFGFAWAVLWFYWNGVDIIPESRRYALEMEMFLTLVVFELFRQTLRAPIVPLRFFVYYAMLAVFLSGWGQVRKYCMQGFAIRRPSPVESSIERRVAERLGALHPSGRVFASGGLRFRLNSWFEIAQVGGGFESGLTNRMPLNLSYQIRTGVNSKPELEGQDAVRELKNLGVEYLVVHGPKSREHYRDFKSPRKFDGLLDVVWHEEDDTIYRVPFTSLAHAIGEKELSTWHPAVLLPASDPYSMALERLGLTASWRGPSRLDVEGAIAEGQLVSVQVNHDPDWTAEQDGKLLAIERDKLGYLVLHPFAATMAQIHLSYRGSVEQRAMATLSALVWLGAALAFARSTFHESAA